MDYLSPIVNACVLNQFVGHWLLSNTLNSTIIMSSKTKEKVNAEPSFESLMNDDSGISFELASLASNIRLDVFGVLDSFLSSMKTYDEKKAHNMLALMLDPRFKNFDFCFFICWQGIMGVYCRRV